MSMAETNEYQRSQTIDASAGDVFAFVFQIGNLPKYLPPIKSAESTRPEQIKLQGEIPNQGTFEGDGYFRVYEDERRMEWGANVGRDYSGQLSVTEQGANSSEVTVTLQFGPRSVDQEVQEQAGDDRNPAQEALAATLESIRRQVEGEGGKVMPPPPPPGTPTPDTQ
jgi:uncharacterized membrane protein